MEAVGRYLRVPQACYCKVRATSTPCDSRLSRAIEIRAVALVGINPGWLPCVDGETGDDDVAARRGLVQNLHRAAAVGAFDGCQQVSRVGAGQLAVENQVGQHGAARLQGAARIVPELPGHQMAGNRGACAEDIDYQRAVALVRPGNEASRIRRDEFADRGLAQELAFGDGADFRVDIDEAVAVQRLKY